MRIKTVLFALIGLLLPLLALSATAQVVTDGLVSYWSFDQSTVDDQVAADIWGENDGTLAGGPQLVEGMVGEALDLDGVDDFVDCGNDESLSFTSEMTLEFWISPRNDNENRHIISKGEWAVGGYWAQHTDPGNVGGIFLYMADVYQDFIVPAGSSELEIWHHFLISYDGTNVVSYRDGELLAEAPAAGEITELDVNFFIGRYAALELHHFDGMIDEVRVYNRGLTAEEAAQNFASEGMAVEASHDKLPVLWGSMKRPRG